MIVWWETGDTKYYSIGPGEGTQLRYAIGEDGRRVAYNYENAPDAWAVARHVATNYPDLPPGAIHVE